MKRKTPASLDHFDVTILSWNIDGLPSSLTSLIKYLKILQPDLTVLQETMALDHIFLKYFDATCGGALPTNGRPMRGFAEFQPMSPTFFFTLPQTLFPETRRWRPVVLNHREKTLLIIHVYFPQATCTEEYIRTLAEIQCYIASSKTTFWIIIGDFNARLADRKDNAATPLLVKWIKNNNCSRLSPVFFVSQCHMHS